MKCILSAGALALITLACRQNATSPGEAHRDAVAMPGGGLGWARVTNPAWPGEPAGFQALSDRPWDSLQGGGWNRRSSSADRIVNDSTAPLEPATALEYIYAAGFAGGTAPATHFFPLGHRKELYIGLLWKASDPWQGHASGVNKIQFVFAESADVYMAMYGRPGGPYELRVIPQWREHDGTWLTPNAANVSPSLGQWHRIEWYLKYESSPGAADGVIKWGLDGVLLGDYTAVRFPPDAGFIEYQLSPTWGGVGDVKRETDFYRFNHTYISSPR